MNITRPRLLMLAAAVLTALLLWFAPHEEAATVSEAVKSTKTPTAAASSPVQGQAERQPPAVMGNQLTVPAERPTVGEGLAGELFAQSTWVLAPPPPPPAPPPGPPPPPPAPTAPALPFVFLGKYSEGSLQLVILSRGNRVLTAAQGDVIETNYRIERIEPARVLVTYLPLGTPQSLATPP